MRIAFIYDLVCPWVKGGAEKLTYEKAKRLARRGHDVHWFGLQWWDGSDIVTRDGIHFHGVCKKIKLYTEDGRRSITEGLYFGFKTLTGIKGKFDLIDCQQFPYFACFSAKFYSIFNKTPLIITWYEVWDKYWYEYLGKIGIFGWAIERMTIKLPKIIVPISEKIKDDLAVLKVPARMMRVIPNGCDFTRLQQIEQARQTFDVIYVGRLISHKNVDVLLKSIAMVQQKIPDIRCGIIGDGPEMVHLKALSNELGLDSNVSFFGIIESDDEVYANMKASKIFVLPSIREGVPNTILEANACGIPVIIVKHKNNSAVSIVKDGYNGYIVDCTPPEIAEKLLFILNNEQELNRLRANATEFAKNYDWELIVNNLEKLYEEII